MSTYQLKLSEFQGPLDKLLELIEAREMEITRLNLAEVTADFLDYLRTLQDIHPKILADFIAVAAKLILIKSHTLLPDLQLSAEEEGEIGELERRLAIYKELKSAEKVVQELWAKNVSYGREFLLNVEPGGFYLKGSVSPVDLQGAFYAIVKDLEAIIPHRESGTVALVNFEEKLKELMARIESQINSSFSELTSGKKKSEIVVFFLALLHLLKDSLVQIEQDGQFSEIQITKEQNNEITE